MFQLDRSLDFRKGVTTLIRLSIFLFFFYSCEYENLDTIKKDVHYSKQIAPIIATHCNVSSCHVSGATIGDFSNYNVLKANVDNRKFQILVFDLRIMPPLTSPRLSSDELELLKNWVDGGALNN